MKYVNYPAFDFFPAHVCALQVDEASGDLAVTDDTYKLTFDVGDGTAGHTLQAHVSGPRKVIDPFPSSS